MSKNLPQGEVLLIPNRLRGAVGLKHGCEALPRAPLKKLFEKSSSLLAGSGSFKNFSATVVFYLIENFRAQRESICLRQISTPSCRLTPPFSFGKPPEPLSFILPQANHHSAQADYHSEQRIIIRGIATTIIPPQADF